MWEGEERWDVVRTMVNREGFIFGRIVEGREGKKVISPLLNYDYYCLSGWGSLVILISTDQAIPWPLTL